MIITINRDVGAGGHTVGQLVAKELGIEFYDRDIIKAAVKASGLDPEEVAQAVAFFASEEASYITGQVIGIDGGAVI